MPMLYNQMGRNRKWKIQDGDGAMAAFKLKISITACA